MIKKEMLDKKNWAVVGATPNKNKFGYKIWKKLIEHEYNTYGVNPNYDSIDGARIYKSLKDIEGQIDVIDVVVPPKVTLNLLDEAKELGIEYIWFQPGTFDEEVIKKAQNLGFKFLDDDCVLATLVRLEQK